MSYNQCSGYGTGCAGNYSSIGSVAASYNSSSGLEYMISNSEVAGPKDMDFSCIKNDYKQKKYFEGYLSSPKITNSYSIDSPFILQNIETKFIGDAKEISEHIEKTFRNITGEEFPGDMIINICSKERLKQFHLEFGGIWNDRINGFAVNRKISGLKSEIFVEQGPLSDVMATLGHEIGHCISAPLDNLRDEEAKAFAFEFAWIKEINKRNIAGLKGCFNINHPAKNNIHDKAFEFVSSLVKKGFEAINICFKLISNELTIGDMI